MSQGVVVEGERMVLRALREEDIANGYLRWMNDPEVTRFLESRFQTWTHEELLDYIARPFSSETGGTLAIVLRDNQRHIGNIRLGPIRPYHGTAAVGVMIGETQFHGQGYGAEAIQLISHYAFEVLGLRKLTAGCYATNVGSYKAFLRAGYKEEGRQVGQWLDDGEVVDGLLLGLLR